MGNFQKPLTVSKAGLRERIRQFALTRPGQRSGLDDATRDRGHIRHMKICGRRDSVVQHAWLFANQWIEFSADDMSKNGDFDHSEHQKRIHELRATAMKEIWEKRGFEGVTALLSCRSAADVVGTCSGLESSWSAKPRVEFLRQSLSVSR